MSDNFDRMLRWRYNIDESEFNRILELQDGHCAVCPVTDALEVDHDHQCCPGSRSCGKCVRGILCKIHNGVLGKTNDGQYLMSLHEYVSNGGTGIDVRCTTRPSMPRNAKIKQPLHYPRVTVEQIRDIRNSTGTVRDIAEHFTVSVGTVHDIRTGKRHSDV